MKLLLYTALLLLPAFLYGQAHLAPTDTFAIDCLKKNTPNYYNHAFDLGIGGFAIEANTLYQIAVSDTSEVILKGTHISLNTLERNGIILSSYKIGSKEMAWHIAGWADTIKKADIKVFNGYIYAAIVFQGQIQILGQSIESSEFTTAFLKLSQEGVLLDLQPVGNLVFHDFRMTLEGPVFCGGYVRKMTLNGKEYEGTNGGSFYNNSFVASFTNDLDLRWIQIFSHNYQGVHFPGYDLNHSIRFIGSPVSGQIYFIVNLSSDSSGVYLNDTLLVDPEHNYDIRYVIGSLSISNGNINWFHIFSTLNNYEISYLWNPNRNSVTFIASNDSILSNMTGGKRWPDVYNSVKFDNNPLSIKEAPYAIVEITADNHIRQIDASSMTERINFLGILDNQNYIVAYSSLNKDTLNSPIKNYLRSQNMELDDWYLLEIDQNFRPVSIISEFQGWFWKYNHTFSDHFFEQESNGFYLNYKYGIGQNHINPDMIMIYQRSQISVNERIFIPNAFSPNNDGINDIFYWYSNGVRDEHIKIYNRNGMKLYEGTGPWDGYYKGNPVSGVLLYFYSGKNSAGEKVERKGTISIAD
ncbi:MAG: gliding motility-associated C-terminal domain-containing protein [Bacteroidia bacterium]